MINKKFKEAFKTIFVMSVLGGCFWASIILAYESYNMLAVVFLVSFLAIIIEYHYVNHVNSKKDLTKKHKRRSKK